ncbi:MAG: phosphoribosylformylglycinamidine synthase I, partial [Pseudomonadota bacterium]
MSAVAAVVSFPGSNRERDIIAALTRAGWATRPVWHGDAALPRCDLIVLPGGFSYGDYLRGGAMAAHSPIMRAVAEKIRGGVAALGVCNGFQILTEAGLLPGVLVRNAGLRFLSKSVPLAVATTASPFTAGYAGDQIVDFPIAHNEG